MSKALHTPNCKWRRRKEARPAEIIDAALDLFVENGFKGTRLDDVAQRAGVSKGTLYIYFDSKESLFRAVVEDIILPEVSKAEQYAAEFRGTQCELITLLVKQWWDVVGKTRLANIPKLMVSEAHQFPELAEFYVEHVVNRVRRLIHTAICAGMAQGEFNSINPVSVTRLLIAPLVFAVIWDKSLAIYDNESYDIDDYIQSHLDIFFHGIRRA